MMKRNHIVSTNGHGAISYHKHLAFFKPGELIFIPKHLAVNIYVFCIDGRPLQIYLHKISGNKESTPISVDFIKAIDEVSRSSISTKSMVIQAITAYFDQSHHHDTPYHAQSLSVVEKIQPLIRDELQRKWSTSEICAQLYISSASLYRALKAENTSFTEILTNERLNAAKILLKKTHKSIDQISYECGFQSQSYFAKKFKAKFHISPTAFRKKNL
ncbi:helix-turn-helix transcriptional regulator [Photobacterium aphoticum]|uniref:helix-turn-helix transcriptional regulator n=2 Tax=Photobacterium aphoticum TaxID=754436 RepID=UPI001304A4A9|nr:helix-turn-helix transcriptional regulator [Photobacterium aphoticum]